MPRSEANGQRRRPKQSLDPCLRQLGIEELWALGYDGQGVRVGHIDTGVHAEHPALAGRVEAAVHCTSRGELKPMSPACDKDGHGTHTAGLICGGRMAGRNVGVAPGATLYSAAALEDGQSLIRVLAGLRWLSQQPIDVACLALGIAQFNPVWWTALACLRRQGVSLVCASGNLGPGFVCAPASYGHLLSVGACELASRRPPSSWRALPSTGRSNATVGRRPLPNLLAPGESLASVGLQSRSDLSVRSTGSSQACALVTGLIALIRQACPLASAYQVESALCQTAQGPTEASYRATQAGPKHMGVVDPVAALMLLCDPKHRLPRARRVPRCPPWFRDPRLQVRRGSGDCILVGAPPESASSRTFRDHIARRIKRARLRPPELGHWPEAHTVWGRLERAHVEALWDDEKLVVFSAGDTGPNNMGELTSRR